MQKKKELFDHCLYCRVYYAAFLYTSDPSAGYQYRIIDHHFIFATSTVRSLLLLILNSKMENITSSPLDMIQAFKEEF